MPSVSTYHVENFGCRATQADGAAVARQFEERGLKRAPFAQADLVILNTCTVTAAADQDARAAIRRVQRQNPNARIIVTGCYAQRAPEEVGALAGVSAVIGNSHKHQLADLALQPDFANPGDREEDDFHRGMKEVPGLALAGEASSETMSATFVPLAALSEETWGRRARGGSRLFVSDIFAHTELLGAPVFDETVAASRGALRTRPNLKVQDGCDNRCSFCVIPFVRGQSRSLPLEQVLDEVNALVAAGYREVVISGINLGRWGRDLGNAGFGLQTSGFGQSSFRKSGLRRSGSFGQESPIFEDLIRAILRETDLEKLRISSVEPMDWSDELIRLVGESPRIAKHAHVPLQSGSDAVLRRMHRKYRPWHYREKIEKIRAAMPNAAIGADVMVGFPGESEAEFDATRRLIEDLPLTYLHVFTYSARPGTPAVVMPNQVPVQVARERNRILRELAEGKKRSFMRSFIGCEVNAITLGSVEADRAEGSRTTPVAAQESDSFTEALSDNYLKVRLKGQHPANHWTKVEVSAVEGDEMIGETR